MQTEGDGESLDVMIENENGESEILWSLQDSWSSEQIWSEGRIELKREEFDDKLYRVNTLKYYASTIRVLSSFDFHFSQLNDPFFIIFLSYANDYY